MVGLTPQRQRQLQKLLARLGLSPTASVNWQWLDLAFTHPTISPTANYEQLEFMGDAVIRLFVANLLWRRDPEGTVGEWSAIRSVLVSDRTLADLAQSYGLDRFLLLGPSAVGDPQGEQSRLANTFEALLGALYLSTEDWSLIQPWLEPQLWQRAQAVREDPAYQNYKAALQQWTQAHYQILPEYKVRGRTKDHKQSLEEGSDQFTAEVWLQGQCLGMGTGRSIKAAEKAAAEVAFRSVQLEKTRS